MVKSFKINLLDWLKTKIYVKDEIDTKLQNKSDSNHTHTTATVSVNGFLSKEDKSKLNGIATEANKTIVDSSLSSSSTNPVQNKIVTDALKGKASSNHNHNNTYSLLNHQHTGLNGKVDAVSNSAGQQSVAGYRKVFRLKITKPYFDSPVSFEFIQRNNRQTARVHILFNSSADSTDPPLQYFTYQGIVKTPFYLYRESAGTWVFITKEQSTYETVNVRFLPLSSNIKDGCTITPLNEYLADLPTDNIHVGSMITATSTQTGYMDYRDKIKLDGIDDGANKTVVDSLLSDSSTNPVQNKVVNSALNGKANTSHAHNDTYYTKDEINTRLGDIETILNEILGV